MKKEGKRGGAEKEREGERNYEHVFYSRVLPCGLASIFPRFIPRF